MQETRVELLPPQWQELYALARAARENAYAPYSNFAVGAAVLGASGRLYSGCNVENASYGLSICGERNAMFAAAAGGERSLRCLCVIADTSKPVSPCGACRQVMREFSVGTVLLANLAGEVIVTDVEELLPYGFEL
jgi:cytidine deaminase